MGAIGALIGGALGSVVPGVGTAIGSAVGGGIGDAINSGGGQAGAQTIPGPTSAVTPEQLQAALANQQAYLKQMEALYGTPTNVAGIGANQTSEIAARQQKHDAYIKYLMSQGMSPQQAQQKADSMMATQGQHFGKDKGFQKWVAAGNAPGLSKAGNSVQAATKYQSGGITTPGISQGLSDAMKALSAEGVGAASGLAGRFAGDTINSFGFKNDARNKLTGMIGDMNSEGISNRDQADIDAYLAAAKQQLGDMNRTNIAGTVGDLLDRGFMSSNLAEGALQHGVWDPQSRFLTSLGGELSDKELAMRNAAAARQAQAFNNIQGAIGSVGTPNSISSILQGVQDPGQAGLFNDVNAAYLANQMGQQNINNRQENQAQSNALQVTPTMQVPNVSSGAPSGLGSLVAPVIGSLASNLGGKINSKVSPYVNNIINKGLDYTGKKITGATKSVFGKIK